MESRRFARRRVVAGYAGLVALVVAWWALRFASSDGTVTPLDTMLYFLPLYQATAARLAGGVLPLWNPYQLCGIPWIATLQAGVFYPTHVLYVLLPLHVALAVSHVIHLAVIAVATAVFARRLGLCVAAVLLAAVVFTLRGAIPGFMFAPNQLEAIAWLPVGAVACVDLARRPGRRPVVLLAASAAMSVLAGYPQLTVYVLYTWALLWTACGLDARPDRRTLARSAVGFAAALGLGALLAGVQLLPGLELTTIATRPPHELEERAMFPISSAFTPAMIPLRFGAIAGMPSSWGVTALALLPAALLAGRCRAVAWLAVVLAVVTELVALGDLTPLYAAYRHLPVASWFRIPTRLLPVTEFGVAMSAAFGLDAIAGGATSVRSRAAAVVAVLAAGGLVWLANAGWSPAGSLPRVAACATALALGSAAASVGGAWVRRASGVAVVAVALVEAATMPWFPYHLPYAQRDVDRFADNAATLRAIAQSAGHERVWRIGSVLQPENAAKLSMLYGLRAINDYEPLAPQRQADMLTFLSEGSTVRVRPPWLFGGDAGVFAPPPGVAPPATRRRLLDLMATRYVVIPAGARRGDPALAAFLDRGGFTLSGDGPHLKIFENRSVLPRAFVTYRARRAPPTEELLRTIARADFDPLAESFVEGDPPPPAPAAPYGHAATFVRDEETDVELDATLATPGLVVLADAFYPGWRATVDGRAAPILATNHLFRGVPVDAGTHRVRFVYAPASVRAGFASSALGLVGVGWVLRRGRRDRGDAQPEGQAARET